jgi:replicative DNA helicase
MADFSIAQRLLSAQTKIPYRQLRRGWINADEGQKTAMAAAGMESWPMEIVNSHVRDVAGIYAAARRVQKAMELRVKGGLRVIIIDYLQLVRAPAKDRFQEVAEASRGIKQMARQIGVPVIALAQISRTVADRDDKRPKLSDLQHSSQIEQDADIVLACHRDHYYLEREGAPRGKDGKVRDEARADFEAALATSKHQMDMLLLKHRHDGIGSVTLGCDMATNRLWDLHDAVPQAAMGF